MLDRKRTNPCVRPWRTGLALGSVLLLSATWTVDDDGPADFSTIQQAINAAANGDEIVVRPGRYREHLSFLGKAITVRSEQGPRVTVVFLEGETRIVDLDGDSTLRGFTITGGRNRVGGGIRVSNGADPVIEENIIVGNEAPRNPATGFPGRGGAIAVEAFCRPVITRNVIQDNRATGNAIGLYAWGGAIDVGDDASAVITNNLIVNNLSTDTGGALNIAYRAGSAATVVIANNTLAGNRAGESANNFSYGGGIAVYDGSFAVIQNNIFSDNVAGYQGGGIYFYPNNDTNFDYRRNDFSNNQPNDCAGLPPQKCDRNQLFLAPLYQDSAGGNYRLRSDSSLIDAGLSGQEGALDLDRRPRARDSDLDGTVAPDLGAYENQGELTRLRFADKTTLEWDGSATNPSMRFELYRDDLSHLGAGPLGQCLRNDLAGATTTDPELPLPGEGFVYLVRGRDAGAGSLGFDSAGNERTPAGPCP